MPKFRMIPISLWTCPQFKNLDPIVRYLFLYLNTNPHTHLSGIYYLPHCYIAHETNLAIDEAVVGLADLTTHNLVRWDKESEVVWVINMLEDQGRGQKVFKAVADQLNSLHDCRLIPDFLDYYSHLEIPYRYPIDTPSVKDKDKEKEKEKEKAKLLPFPVAQQDEDIPYDEIIDYLNKQTGKRFRSSSKHNRKHIQARWCEGFGVPDFRAVVDSMAAK